MRIIEWSRFLTEGLPGTKNFTAMTIGVFDGIHRGHKALIDRVVSHVSSASPVVVTFRQNHKKNLQQQHTPLNHRGDIFSFRQKMDSLENLGIALAIVIDFSESIRHMPGLEFIRILQEHGKMGYLAVGSNFRCGYHLDTDAPMIQKINEKLGIPTDVVEVLSEDSLPISSSRIRSAIAQGNLQEAAAMLGHPYVIDISDAGDSSAQGVYDLAAQGRILPPPGKYPVRLYEGIRGAGTPTEIQVEQGVIRIPGSQWEYVEFLI
ncbi:FAD synthetase family protein [Leadbettera azotonutricia]|uniref:FAD synthase n=1 Tax=Leadbettera azotonutricia (strain ATCC BAA-888 / DSM 13862 / ZAS-9) TaxID=545695 RepID=F5YBW0_LEAAZ|nr:FAD synthetase family protein [Leadbettera azotonutricia]AEF82018.1 putative riboflavin biosynthesis protein [Leadbettera azotonutricia ZAS-9]